MLLFDICGMTSLSKYIDIYKPLHLHMILKLHNFEVSRLISLAWAYQIWLEDVKLFQNT